MKDTKHNLRCKKCGKFMLNKEAIVYTECFACDPYGESDREVSTATVLENEAVRPLPLVEFFYPDSKTGNSKRRYVHVTKHDGEYIEGYEVERSFYNKDEGHFKRFLVDRLISLPVLLEYNAGK